MNQAEQTLGFGERITFSRTSTPSLVTWQLFSRVLFEELQKDNYIWLVGEFPEEFLSLNKALN